MQVDLKGKKVLVTGSSRGIGKEIARQLVQAGAIVAAHYHKNSSGALELSNEFGDQVVLIQGDLGQPNQVSQVFNRAVAELNGLEVLINNAGIALHSPLSKSITDWLSDWEQTLQVNLIAAAALCKMAVNLFTDHGGGRIINISSRAAFRGDTSEYWAYAASKGGMVSLTRSIARGFGKQGVVAFNIAPGFVRTDMAQEFINQYGEQQVMKDIALDKLTVPNDIAPTVALLCSGLADHATGTTIDFNAGSYLH
jgi:NAD(P)-dependent dehydrogenase (short-subunit alcohol dehydrogenase family)